MLHLSSKAQLSLNHPWPRHSSKCGGPNSASVLFLRPARAPSWIARQSWQLKSCFCVEIAHLDTVLEACPLHILHIYSNCGRSTQDQPFFMVCQVKGKASVEIEPPITETEPWKSHSQWTNLPTKSESEFICFHVPFRCLVLLLPDITSNRVSPTMTCVAK